jgi:two-component SAPR family response regulator
MAKVLVLDDVFDAVNLVKRVLQAAGHEVFGFTDEKDALGFIKENQVDLAILDIKLKHKTGVDILAEIKNITPAPAQLCSPHTRRSRPPRKVSGLAQVSIV